MTRKKLPNSLRKFLRREKARLRREVSDTREAEQKIQELVHKFYSESKKLSLAVDS